jgi:isocitrate dehydrogenase
MFACVRSGGSKGSPLLSGILPLVDMHIFRENTEDIYAGIEYMTGESDTIKLKNFLVYEMGVNRIRFPDSTSFGIKPISKDGSERLIRAAIIYAIERKLPSVTLVHKGNIMKFTEGSFKNWGYDLAENEFGSHTYTWRQYEKIKNEKGRSAADKSLEEARQQKR